MSIEAMKQARQIIWRYRHETPLGNQPYMISHEADQTIERIDQAIANAEKQEHGEPVAVVTEESTFDGYLRKGIAWNFRLDSFDIGTKFYTTPQQRKPLTDEMREQMRFLGFDTLESRTPFVAGWLKAEAAHGIKE